MNKSKKLKTNRKNSPAEKSKSGLVLSTSALALAVSAALAQETPAADTDDTLEEIIVTGVFKRIALEEAPVAVTALSGEELAQAAPTSAADLIKSVPGVFVNSGLGEIRNIVYSRGVSAGSNEAASGYFYVSLQEDGLPVSNPTFSNYGPDYFSRPDLTLARLEALRGGTATITGPNAPGGIFNYISKTGRSHAGGEVALKYGLEGDGRNPHYRADFYYGGETEPGSRIYYSIGGFYRESDGARDPGYTLNAGGQVRANALFEYDSGEVLISAKYHGDSNGFFEFLPARNFNNPQYAPGISPYDSFLPPAAPHAWTDPGGGISSWDGSNLVESEQISLSLKWDHEFGGGWNLSNNFRYADSSTNWNSGAVIFALPVNDPFVYILSNTFGIPGTFQFTDRQTGNLVAEVVSTTGFDHTVTQSDLPNPQILENGVLTQVAFDPAYEVDEVMNLFTLSRAWDAHSISAGFYYAKADIFRRFDGGGLGISGIRNQPQLYDITLDLGGGTVIDVTSPEGFAALGDTISAGNRSDGTQEQYSLFFGHTWDFTDQLSFDWGVRYENVEYDITNILGTPQGFDPAQGGSDGNPLTLYDNFPNTLGEPLSAKRDYDYVSYSLSLAYAVNDNLQTYIRYSSGEKAPDFQTMVDLDTADEINSLFVEAEEIQQFEIGLRYSGEQLTLALFPFWSELDNVTDPQLFNDQDGISYTPAPIAGRLTTVGVEIEADYQITDTLSVRTALTLQKSDSEDFGFWVQNTPSREDDVISEIPDGDADNIPDFMGRTTLSYAPLDQLSAFLTWNYLGDRPANRWNTFDLPAFSIFDAGVSFAVSERIRLRLDIKNLLNEEEGVLSWAPSGGFLQSLDRQAFTPAQLTADPDQVFSIITAQPRSTFVSASYAF